MDRHARATTRAKVSRSDGDGGALLSCLPPRLLAADRRFSGGFPKAVAKGTHLGPRCVSLVAKVFPPTPPTGRKTRPLARAPASRGPGPKRRRQPPHCAGGSAEPPRTTPLAFSPVRSPGTQAQRTPYLSSPRPGLEEPNWVHPHRYPTRTSTSKVISRRCLRVPTLSLKFPNDGPGRI